jgi:lysophospholipase L1-like esterase
MKSVLCYGDSNTWGFDPATRERFPPNVRWTGILAAALGADYRVIEEGLNGRTTRWDDPIELHRNGLAYLVPCLESHQPIDLVLIMLGTNDLKARFRLSAGDIAQSAAGLGQIAARTARDAAGQPATVLLIAPPPVASLSGYDLMFEGAAAKSALFADYYARAADWHGLAFFDAGSVIRSSDLDGIHFEDDQHRTLGEALAGTVRELLG